MLIDVVPVGADLLVAQVEANAGPLDELHPVVDVTDRTWRRFGAELPIGITVDLYLHQVEDQQATMYVISQFAPVQIEEAATDLIPRILDSLTFESPTGTGSDDRGGPDGAGPEGDGAGNG